MTYRMVTNCVLMVMLYIVLSYDSKVFMVFKEYGPSKHELSSSSTEMFFLAGYPLKSDKTWVGPFGMSLIVITGYRTITTNLKQY